MKKLFLLVILGLITLAASAQTEKSNEQKPAKLLNEQRNGGYGALSLGYSKIDEKSAFVMGARGMAEVSQSVAIGLGVVLFTNDASMRHWSKNQISNDLVGAYGGFCAEPMIGRQLPVHISFPVLFGAGAVALANGNNPNHWDQSQQVVYFVFEPALEVGYNLTRHFQMAATFSYRATSKIDIQTVDRHVLNGLKIGLILKFGKV
jgi:opacity protein-like surface antigen